MIKKGHSQRYVQNQCLLRYRQCSCDLYSRCCLWFPRISTKLSALRRTQVRTLSKIPGFNRITWQAFSIRYCNTSKSLFGAAYTKAFRCSHSQKSKGLKSGDGAGQLTCPPRPIHCSPKVWFRCCLTIRRNWGCVPSSLNHYVVVDERHMF
jgi:hypothetical protein